MTDEWVETEKAEGNMIKEQLNSWGKSTRQDIEVLTLKIKIVFVFLFNSTAGLNKKTAHAADQMSETAHFHLRRKRSKSSDTLSLKSASSLGSFHYTPHLWLPRVQLPFVRTQKQRVVTWM